jgi:uncharacterized phage-associated protein
MSQHTAAEIAKWFLAYNRTKINEEGGEFISNLKLQKLLYYAQGCFLAITDSPLFAEPIIAWGHGPVVESVYLEYKENGANGIVFDDDFDFEAFTDDENNLLIEVFDTFGQYSAWKLREMAHNETPWQETDINNEISQDSIKQYFKEEYID